MKLGHDHIAHADMDLESMGQNLLEMRGESFNDISASLGNVKGLLPKAEERRRTRTTQRKREVKPYPMSRVNSIRRKARTIKKSLGSTCRNFIARNITSSARNSLRP